ncbi:hypothetical protein AcW1_008885 [Taiwanofungus camphoratus]|nr:hypothetical protein AcW1_008885 [Antrodia cinnamomea]KAI0958976.1 hypothetical protein AcV7_004643 [Antrodia cinnamomea]
MPEGCSTWPAFWTVSQTGSWPNGGGIDVIERVNLKTYNQASLHTTANYTMPASVAETGHMSSKDCLATTGGNRGCDITFGTGTFGSPFNASSGGWYVMERSAQDGIRIWFWARDDTSVPAAVAHPSSTEVGTATVTPSGSWGEPVASFPMGPNCDYETHFDAHRLIFDLTFCVRRLIPCSRDRLCE